MNEQNHNEGPHRNPNSNPNPQPEGNSNGTDIMATISNLWEQGNRRRLVIRHQGETMLRLPLAIAVIIALIMLWQSPFFLVVGIALVFFLRLQVSFERRPDRSRFD